MNLIKPEVAQLNQTLHQLLQENEQNQTKMTQLEKTLAEQNAKDPERPGIAAEIGKVIKSVADLLKCDECDQYTNTQTISGPCGHTVCLNCKVTALNPPPNLATVYDIVDQNKCTSPECKSPASFKTVPIVALQEFASLFFNAARPKDSGPITIQDNDYVFVNTQVQKKLGRSCMIEVYSRVSPKQWKEGVFIRFPSVTNLILFKSFRETLEEISRLSVITNYSRQTLLVKDLPCDPPAKKQKTPKTMCVVDVSNNGHFTIKQHPLLNSKSLVFKETEEKESHSQQHKLEKLFGWGKFEHTPQFPFPHSKEMQTLFYDFREGVKAEYSKYRENELYDKLGKTLTKAGEDKDTTIRIIQNYPTNYCVTDFLSNPPSLASGHSGAGVEYIVEGKAPKLNAIDPDEVNSMIQMLGCLVVAMSYGNLLRDYLKQPKSSVIPLGYTGSKEFDGASVVISPPNPPLPSHFYLGLKKVNLVAVKLLGQSLPLPLDIASAVTSSNLSAPLKVYVAEGRNKERNAPISKSRRKKLSLAVKSSYEKQLTEEFRKEHIRPVNPKEFDFHVKKSKQELAAFLQTHFPSSKVKSLLPPPDVNYVPSIQLSGVFARFAPPSDLKKILEPMFTKANDSSFTDTIIQYIRSILWPFSAENIIYDFQHYIRNPQLYIAGQRFNIPESKAIALFSEGKKLHSWFLQRIQWAIDIQKKAQTKPDLNFCLKVVAIDLEWIQKTQTLGIKFLEFLQFGVGKENDLKWDRFRIYKEKGMQWPHAKGMLIEIENAGFQFTPALETPDKCSCKCCGKTFEGALVQFTPWKFHDYSKHSPGFEELTKQGKAKGKQ